jgi:hypothetical protein
LGRSRRRKTASEFNEQQEYELAREVARQFRTADPKNLEAELSRKILEVKSRRLPPFREWEAYLRVALRNHAINLIRKEAALGKRQVSFDSNIEGTQDISPSVFSSALFECGADSKIAFQALMEDLNPRLRNLLRVMLEENGNQIAVARQLSKHRNTIRLWIAEMRRVALRHGFGQSPPR